MWYKNCSQPIIALAPMADMTDGPFCRILRQVESQKSKVKSSERCIIFREMVSAEAIVRGSEKTLKMCEFKEEERPIVQQIFGGNAEVITKAAEIIMKKYKPDGIDVNMGCPVPKISGKAGAGAALMKDHKRAVDIVKALKKANFGVPISIKTRLGWADDNEILEFAQKLENAGADLISIHGRTKKQGYSGKANWDRIREVKDNIKIPIIANGDITSGEDIEKCLKTTGADGVMIGRGALGNPWMLKSSEFGVHGSEVAMKERIKIVLMHARLHEERYGTVVTFRKHLVYYFKGIVGVKKLRQELVKVSSIEELEEILSGIDIKE